MKLAVFCLTSIAAVAAQASDYTDTAKVVSSRPIYQSYTTQECRTVTTAPQPQAQGERQMGGSILGGVAGALLGSQVGQGNGKVAAGALGAIAGAIAGDRIQNNPAQAAPQSQQVCHDVQRQEISGYEVHYIYAGHRASTVMSYPPGNTITIEVTAVQQ